MKQLICAVLFLGFLNCQKEKLSKDNSENEVLNLSQNYERNITPEEHEIIIDFFETDYWKLFESDNPDIAANKLSDFSDPKIVTIQDSLITDSVIIVHIPTVLEVGDTSYIV
jgi:hypothetical protein